ncbi:hypothetical protein GCM10027168_10740 [Streptomyces capparidis]
MNSDRNGALFAAVERHDADAVAALLRAGTDPDTPRGAAPHWRPLHAAVEELEHAGPLDTLVLLLRAGADPNAWDGAHDATPLLMASFREQREAVRLLLAAGADPGVTGAEGDTPLVWWTALGDTRTAALLLRSGAPPDPPGGLHGMTALGVAARNLDIPMLRLLRAHGADPHARDADRLTAYDRLPERDPDHPSPWEEAAALLT